MARTLHCEMEDFWSVPPQLLWSTVDGSRGAALGMLSSVCLECSCVLEWSRLSVSVLWNVVVSVCLGHSRVCLPSAWNVVIWNTHTSVPLSTSFNVADLVPLDKETEGGLNVELETFLSSSSPRPASTQVLRHLHIFFSFHLSSHSDSEHSFSLRSCLSPPTPFPLPPQTLTDSFHLPLLHQPSQSIRSPRFT